MKVYQLIYTSVQHSLSDPELGLVNQSGLRVFSCTQGVTRQNIDEIIRFATYRIPKNNEIEYTNKPCDPSVPELFPKIFRTLKLSDGRYAAMQISYAGCDFEGEAGNVFAHAFVFDDVDDGFMPEKYCGHPLYRTHLTEKDLTGQIVHYLKPLDDIEPTEGLENKVIDFIESHKSEMTYILDKAAHLLTSDEVNNLCIATMHTELTQRYLLALKWLLPRDAAENLGISTYNVYLPSDKQKKIVFHGTVKGHNNITSQAVEARKNCIYIDVENTKFKKEKSQLFKFSVQELREIYAKYKFTSISQLLDWEATHENISKTGIGGKLIRLKKSAGDHAFKTRVMEIYPAINDLNMREVKFELSKIMFDNIELFESEKNKVTEIYMGQCLEKLCSGNNVDIANPFSDDESASEQAAIIRSNMKSYMDTVRTGRENITEKNKVMLLSFLGRVKHNSGVKTWKELFENKDDLKLFVSLAAEQVITGSGMNAFTPLDGWEKDDLSELVAYFEASTKDVFLKKSCLKYIQNTETDWKKYGISITKHTKTKGEQEADIRKIRRMLTKVGYIPYQRSTYASLKGEVTDDIRNNNSPLLISKLLYAVYRWQGTYGNQIEAEKNAKKVRELLLKMRKTEVSCYNFMIPKLALEILESPGHYHEVMVNTETMPPSFWNWFLIGYNKLGRDEDKLLAYTRVYNASKMKMSKVPAKKKMRETFQDAAD